MTGAEPMRLAGTAGLIRGYASLFGATDLSGDRVLPGAFLASLARRGAGGIRMLWQHDPARPIGIWTTLTETATGLLAEGRLATETAGGREAFALIRAGAVDGLSIGFRTRLSRRGSEGAKRLLAEIDLWEISVVTFPMQDRARLAEARGGPMQERAPLAEARGARLPDTRGGRPPVSAAGLAERLRAAALRFAAGPTFNPSA